MATTDVVVNRGAGRPLSEAEAAELFSRQQLQPYRWSNNPHDVYPPHVHTYEKVLRVVTGSIRFTLPNDGKIIDLSPGDEMILPSNVVHAAEVGPDGVVCLEAHRRS